MAPHSSTLAWQVSWTEEPGRLRPMGSLGVRHDWATSLSCVGEGNGNPLQCSCPENPRDRGAWWAAVYGVAQSRTWLKWLSRSSSSSMHTWSDSIWAALPPSELLRTDKRHIQWYGGSLQLCWNVLLCPSASLLLFLCHYISSFLDGTGVYKLFLGFMLHPWFFIWQSEAKFYL